MFWKIFLIPKSGLKKNNASSIMNSKSAVTYVTAFLDLKEDRSKDKSPEKCFVFFKNLAESGISICLFVSPKYHEFAKFLSQIYKNIYLFDPVEIEDLWSYKTATAVENLKLPPKRTDYHDTFNFFCLMNSKIEFVKKAMEINPYQTSHFSWIDFSICHVIRSQSTLIRLATYGRSLLKTPMFTFPGCYTKEKCNNLIKNVCDCVLWRFCGGFFIGDSSSLNSFYNVYLTQFPRFLQEKRTLVWEVNFWAWLENQGYFQPDIYIADHNDSMLMIPHYYLQVVASLTTIPPRYERCKATIRSLLQQVDHIYLSVCSKYERFGRSTIPDFSKDIEFSNKLTIVESKDYGPATKYLGALSLIPDSSWIFFCDDDQEYKSDCVENMKKCIFDVGAYQNRYHIVCSGSGGIIHGYVGNMFHKSLLANLSSFDLPSCSRFVDDQWMSIYCFFNNIQIYPTNLQKYSDIYSVLRDGFEQIGEESLASFGNRDQKVAELANYFKVKFLPGGAIQRLE